MVVSLMQSGSLKSKSGKIVNPATTIAIKNQNLRESRSIKIGVTLPTFCIYKK